MQSEPIPWPVQRLVAQLGPWSARPGPLYRLLAEVLGELIDSGRLPPRAVLPPDRILADRLAVGRSTAVAAYDLLRDSGRLERRQGKGTWVAPVQREERRGGAGSTTNPLFLAYLSSPDRALPLACTGSYGPPQVLTEAYAAALSVLTHASPDTGYHPLGHFALREALADRYQAAGVPTAPDHILVTNGGQHALTLLVRFLVAPGDRVLVPVPCYPGALEVFREAGAELVTVPVGPAGLDVGEWTHAVNATKPRAAYLNLTHHNPTGTTVPDIVRYRIAEVAAANGVTLIDDTVVDDLGFAGPPPIRGWDATGARVLGVGSLSKTVWGGLRVGWIRGRPADIGALVALRAVHDLGGSVLDQLAASLLVPILPAIARHRGTELRQRHDHLHAELAATLPEWEIAPVGGGQCLWVRLPESDATAFAQVAMRHGAVVMTGISFAPEGGCGDRLRIPFTAPECDLTDAVRALAQAWSGYRRGGAGAHAATPNQLARIGSIA